MYAYTQPCHSPHTQTHTQLYKHLDLGEAAETVIKETGALGTTEFERDPRRVEKPRGTLKATQMGLKFSCAIVKRQNLYMTCLFRAFEVVSEDDGHLRLCRGSVPL